MRTIAPYFVSRVQRLHGAITIDSVSRDLSPGDQRVESVLNDSPPLTLSQPLFHYVVILFFTFVTHGLLLLNDGRYGDDWIVYAKVIERNWNAIHREWVSGTGTPEIGYFHWFIGYLPWVTASYKVLAFSAIVLFGILIYSIGTASRLLSRFESLALALIGLTYPAYQTSVQLTLVPYALAYAAFLLAVLMAIRSDQSSGIAHYALRLGSLAAFAMSFMLNSLLVFYFGVLWFLWACAQSSRVLSRSLLSWFVPHRLDFVLLPFTYWALRKYFYPTGEYNRIELSPFKMAATYYLSLQNAVYGQLDISIRELLTHPVLWLVIWLAAGLAYARLKVGSVRPVGTKVSSGALLAFGLVLLGCAIFPYAVVGKAPSLHGLNTRHALLISLPVAILVLAAVRLCFTSERGTLSGTGFAFLASALLAFALATLDNYVGWQARWVRDRSVMLNLSQTTDRDGNSVFWIEDQWRLDPEERHKYYEWASIFKSVWGGESRIGLDRRIYGADYVGRAASEFHEVNNLSEFDPNGRQAELTIRRGARSYDDLGLVSRYLFYKYWRPSKLDGFLSALTDIEVKPASSSRLLLQ